MCRNQIYLYNCRRRFVDNIFQTTFINVCVCVYICLLFAIVIRVSCCPIYQQRICKTLTLLSIWLYQFFIPFFFALLTFDPNFIESKWRKNGWKAYIGEDNILFFLLLIILCFCTPPSAVDIKLHGGKSKDDDSEIKKK
jgi:hypothetical protein